MNYGQKKTGAEKTKGITTQDGARKAGRLKTVKGLQNPFEYSTFILRALISQLRVLAGEW